MNNQTKISTDYERLHIQTINRYILVLLSSLWIIYVVVDLLQGDLRVHASNTRLTLLLIVILVNYFLSSRLNYRLTSAITLVALILAFLLYPSLPVGINVADVILLFFLVIVISVIPYLAYDIHLDKAWIISWIAISFMSALFSFFIALRKISQNVTLDPLQKNVAEIFQNEPMIIFAFIASFIFIHLLIYLNRRANVKLLFKVKAANEELSSSINEVKTQGKTLEERNKELEKLQSNLKSINQNLEEIVEQQTEELKTKNEELLRFAFMNSHLLRAPISRLQGLLMLRKYVDNEELTPLFRSTVDELIETTLVIGKVVNKKVDDRELSKIENRVNQLYVG